VLYFYAFIVELAAFPVNSVVMTVNKIFFLLGLAVFFQACGQTGPLYMPDGPAPIYVPQEEPDEEQ